MKRLIGILLLLSCPTFAQSPPVIHSIVPASGSGSGGTTVTISGENLSLPPNFACLLPCPTRVAFGGKLATLEQESNTTVVVKTPAHLGGRVDIVLTTGDGRTATAPQAFSYTGDTEAQNQRLLLPIYLEQPVRGISSLWETQLWIRNNGATPVTLAPWPCPPGVLCLPVFPLTYALQPGETLKNLPAVAQTNPGRILYAHRDGANNLSAGLRLRELTRSELDAGTEIPVVRESELLSSPAHLHAVPLNGQFRLMLRIYELDADEARFHVRVYAETEGTSSGPALSDFLLFTKTAETGLYPYRPGYAEYGAFTDLLQLPMVLPEMIRVDVEPLTPGSRYWTFVSVTNNETQRVTLITPQ